MFGFLHVLAGARRWLAGVLGLLAVALRWLAVALRCFHRNGGFGEKPRKRIITVGYGRLRSALAQADIRSAPVVPTGAPKARSGGTSSQQRVANRRDEVPPLRRASLGFGRDDGCSSTDHTSAQAAGDHAHLAWGGDPHRDGADDAERDAERKGDRVGAGPVVEQAG